MHPVAVFIVMAASAHFLDSIVAVSALTHPSMLSATRTVPYLRTRCRGPTPPTANGSAAQPPPPTLLHNPVSLIRATMPFPNARVTGTSSAATFPQHSHSEHSSDTVKRFRISDEVARSVGTLVNVSRDAAPACGAGAGTGAGAGGGVSDTGFYSCDVRWSTVVQAAAKIYEELGPGCSEKAYQNALVRRLYNMDIPCLMERTVYIVTDGMSVSATGRVDIEVQRRFILELKVSPATAATIRKDRKQLRRYIYAYKTNGVQLEKAALVYFGNNEVRIVEENVYAQ
jgi:GxxExxY protein